VDAFFFFKKRRTDFCQYHYDSQYSEFNNACYPLYLKNNNTEKKGAIRELLKSTKMLNLLFTIHLILRPAIKFFETLEFFLVSNHKFLEIIIQKSCKLRIAKSRFTNFFPN
jgi:hypothetical protein